MSSPVIIEDWDSDAFHRQVLEMEAKGYVSRQETYQITAITNPETGHIIHRHRVEMYVPDKSEA